MKYFSLIIPLFVILNWTSVPHLSGSELLDKAIEYHDPSDEWPTLAYRFHVEGSRPDGSVDTTEFFIDNRKSEFKLVQTRKGIEKSYQVNGETCLLKLNGSADISKETAKANNLTCDRAKRIRNYYTYLWGLPMKLKDPGTLIDSEVVEEQFQGVDCYKMKVTYEKSVGKDIWYFYFKKENYALHGYKFYHDESKNDGEYITLEGEEQISKMKLPKLRKWYYNKDQKYLGTDNLLLGASH